MTVSDFQILIKPWSIESRNDPRPKSEVVNETNLSLKISYLTYVRLAQLGLEVMMLAQIVRDQSLIPY